MELPSLGDEPQQYADCCLSLSGTLIETLSTTISSAIRSGFVLSIGSGSGLLEALLQRRLKKLQLCEIHIEGVEVRSDTDLLNRYLPEELVNTVAGTWALCSRAEIAAAMMFVYPRTVALVKRYLDYYARLESAMKVVIWLGPKLDWSDFKPCFRATGFELVETFEHDGLARYEMMATLRRSGIQNLCTMGCVSEKYDVGSAMLCNCCHG